MASKQLLKEANYIHRGENGEYIEGLGQCSFSPCDYSKIIKDNTTGMEYRYCTKLQIPVDSYDSCKYHSEKEWTSLVGQMANLLQHEDEIKRTQKQSKKHWILIPIIICICICIYLLIK